MSTRDDCGMFNNLVFDRIEDDKPWSTAEMAFIDQHKAMCESCALEAGIIAHLKEGPDHPPLTTSSEAVLELKARQDVLRHETFLHKRTIRNRRLRWALAAPIAAGIAVALYFSFSDRSEPSHPVEAQDTPAPTAPSTFAHFERVDGVVNIKGRVAAPQGHLHPGDAIEVKDGSAFMALGTEGSVFIDRESRLSLVDMTRKATRLKLDRGRAAFKVRPRKNKRVFTVDTAVGQFRVVGTAFCVNVSGPDKYELQVTEGTVYFKPTDGDGISVTANQSLSSEHGLRPLTDTERTAVVKMTELGEKPETMNAPSPEVGERLATVKVRTGTEPHHRSPKSAPPVRLEEAPASPQKRGKPNVADLLAEVRDRREDRDWKGVIAAYQKLMRMYPTSLEARTCLVPMGKIQLNNLGRPKAALKSFRAYLKASSQGALAQEARWGIALSLRDLGRTAEEIRALKVFKQRFPDSLFIPVVETRLETLREE